MTQSISVNTGARLHFGFFSCKPAEGRQFGGVGLMLDSPGFEILIARSPVFRYHGPEAWRERVESLASRIRDGVSGSTATHSVGANAHPPRARRAAPPEFRVEICREIPPHAGLGSGTQLALALAAGLARFLGGEHFTAESLARCASRGTRSALGIHGFLKGGFLIDAGKLPHEELGTLTARAECPSAWRFVLVTPLGKAGLAGRDEMEAFHRLPPMPRHTTERLRGIAHEEMLPALLEGDAGRFGDSLFEYGRLVGSYFAPVQGGIFARREMEELVDRLRARGLRGVGQTSWGPTIFALCENDVEADELVRDLRSRGREKNWRISTAAPRNEGARVCAPGD